MKIKKYKLCAVLAALCALFSSCAVGGFKGFYDEDLTKYLTLGEYKGLKLTEYDVSASDAEIDERINKALASFAVLTEVDEEIDSGATVKFDRFCYLSGASESTPELSELGGVYSFDTEDKVVSLILPLMNGMKKGETKNIEVTLPAGYVSSAYPETRAVYRVTVLSVSKMITPELDETSAPKIFSDCKTADECRLKMKNVIEAEKETEAEYKRGSEAWKKVVSDSVLFDTPYDVYSAYCEDIYYSYKGLADAESEELNAYLESSYGMDRDEFDDMVEERALSMTKEAFVLYSIVKNESITYTEAELTAYASRAALESGGAFASGDEYIEYYGEDAVSEMLLKDRVIELILSHADDGE